MCARLRPFSTRNVFTEPLAERIAVGWDPGGRVHEDSSSAIAYSPELEASRFGLVGAGATHLGTRHEHNEDRFAVQRASGGGALLVVCDGMGGMGRGDQASSLALTRLVEILGRGHDAPKEAAAAAVRQVDRELVATLGDDGSGRRPGTTCAVVQVDRGRAYVTWVGDSAVLWIRDRKVLAATRPHRLVQDLVDQGAMSADEARTSPMARFLSRSLGGRPAEEPTVEPDALRTWRLRPGDAIVVCSDGLTDTLRPQDIAAIVAGGGTEEQTAQALIREALARKVDDNVTVIVARCVHAAVVAEEELLAPAWDLVPETTDEEGPDFEADLPARPAPVAAGPAAEVGRSSGLSPLLVAGIALAFGGVGLGLLAIAVVVLLS